MRKPDKLNILNTDLVLIDTPQERGVLVRVLSGNPAIAGIECPVNSRPPFSTEESLAWENCVEQLVARGVRTASSISKHTGLSIGQSKTMLEKIASGWAASMSTSLVNSRREALWQEAERVKEEAWESYYLSKSLDDDPKVQGAWLKLVLDAGGSQAKLCGLNLTGNELPDTNKPSAITPVIKNSTEMMMEAERKLRLPRGNLELLGNIIAKHMSTEEPRGDSWSEEQMEELQPEELEGGGEEDEE